MKNIFFTLAILIFSIHIIQAQCASEVQITVDNHSFENWALEGEGNYEDPAGDFWDTANRTVDILPLVLNPNVVKSEDAHTGTYSARLRTNNWFTLTTSATIFTGSFNPNQADPLESIKFGKPFTDRPDYFRVWYKYEPVQGDSAELYTYLTRWNGSSRDTVGEVYTKVYDPKLEWTLLDKEFTYFMTESPDSISIVFASSAAGDSFEGQEGNTLYIDDVELYYCATSTSTPFMSEISVKAYPNPPTNGIIRFETSKVIDNGLIRIFSNDGKEVYNELFSGDVLNIDISKWTIGTYRFAIYDNETSSGLSSGSILLKE